MYRTRYMLRYWYFCLTLRDVRATRRNVAALHLSGCIVVKPAARLTPKYLPTPRHKGRRYREWTRGQARQEGAKGPRGRLPSACSLRFFSPEEMHVTNPPVHIRGFVMIEACDSSSPSPPRSFCLSVLSSSSLSRFSLHGASPSGNYVNRPLCFFLSRFSNNGI